MCLPVDIYAFMYIIRDMSNTETTTGNTIPVVIDGRNYTIHTDQMGTTCLSHVYRITGTRKADGALCIHHTGEYKGRAVAVGISHLAGLNWWDFREVVELLGEEAA